ncbi:50S ribosomal protein L24, partial [Halorubrum ezzemoulense]
GEESEVTEVDLTDAVIYVDGVVVEKADGEEVPRPLQASNVRVTELDLEDDVREARLKEDNE